MKKFLILAIFVMLNAQPIVPIPEHVDYNKDKAFIGKILFFDPNISRDGKVRCASCHEPQFGGADNKQFSIGVFGRIDKPMNSPPAFNAVFNCWQFWNGRAKTLQEQARMANQDHFEMDMTDELLEKRVNANPVYKKLFKNVYKSDYITADMVYDAIAEFEKALITPNSRFDKYLKGDKKALNEEEKRGYFLFKAYGCVTCHNGVNMGGNSFQKLGVFFEKISLPRGRDRYEVTKREEDKYVYKVPSLRNIAVTAPYMHDGSVKNLKKAIVLMGRYNLGIDLPEKDVDAIYAFFQTLTGEMPKILKSGK
ncbi:cytochrome-c peroxidase [Caminibacter sp.]